MPKEKAADRWLAWIAVLALPVLALALWSSYGTSLFVDMAAGFWAMCF